ncbi:MAG: hypothetical protein WKF68_04035 [Daejeonella sp.]
MKSITIQLTFSLLVASTLSFANEDGIKSVKNSAVPVADYVWEASQAEVPLELKFLKAKSAFVPVAGFVWGSPSDTPDVLNKVAVPAYVLTENNETVPEGLAFIKAKSVPVAPFVTGDPLAEAPLEIAVN